MNSVLMIVQETWLGDRNTSSKTICTCETYDGAIRKVNSIAKKLLNQGYMKSPNEPILFYGNLIYMIQLKMETRP